MSDKLAETLVKGFKDSHIVQSFEQICGYDLSKDLNNEYLVPETKEAFFWFKAGIDFAAGNLLSRSAEKIRTAEERLHPLAIDDKSVWCNAYYDEVLELRAAYEALQKELGYSKMAADAEAEFANEYKAKFEALKAENEAQARRIAELEAHVTKLCSGSRQHLYKAFARRYKEILSLRRENEAQARRIAELEDRLSSFPIPTSVAMQKIGKLRSEGFKEYAATVLNKENQYCIVGDYGDVRWIYQRMEIVMSDKPVERIKTAEERLAVDGAYSHSDRVLNTVTLSFAKYDAMFDEVSELRAAYEALQKENAELRDRITIMDEAAKYYNETIIGISNKLHAENEALKLKKEFIEYAAQDLENQNEALKAENEAQAKRIVLLEYDVKHLKDALRAYGDEDIDDDED